jgi:hypothetical protein
MDHFQRTFFLLVIAGCLAGCNHELTPQHYCYRCCACIGIGSLALKPNNTFEIDYEFPLKRKQAGKMYYGKGTYVQDKKKLFLTFEDLPPARSEITLKKIRDSDSLVVIITTVRDPLSGDTIYGANVQCLSAAGKVIPAMEPEATVYNKKDQTVLRHQMKEPVTLQSSFIGYRTAQRTIDQPGVYHAEVKLAFGYSDVVFRRGDQKTFRISRSDGQLYIRDMSNRKIFFTLESCYCN